jgi:serine/threonine protein kinase
MTDYLVNPLKQKPSTLAEQISWKKRKDDLIDIRRCSLLACLDIAEALKFMHKANILHGDLKPHNILFVTDNQVCVAYILLVWTVLLLRSR